MINLKIGSHLILDRDEGVGNNGAYQIINTQSGHAIIGVEESLVSQPAMTTQIEWKDIGLVLQTCGDEPAHAIQGTGVDDSKVAFNWFVSIPAGYKMIWSNQGIYLYPTDPM